MKTVIIDNYFENVAKIRKMALSNAFEYNTRGATNGLYEGKRSQDLREVDPELGDKIIRHMINAYRGIEEDDYEYDATLHFHYNSKSDADDEIFKDIGTRIHVDKSLLTAIVYLTPYPKENSGIQLYIGEQPEVIQNRFNRLVMFEASKIPHSMESFFGNDRYDSRLTLLCFVYDLKKK